jgi:hypothetical protein
MSVACAATIGHVTARWVMESTPKPTGALASQLSAVSCPSTSDCIAVGNYVNRTLAESWNGKRWSIQSTPNPGAATSELVGVSCASANACTAVGYYLTTTTQVTLAEHWNGATWSVQSTPNPNTSSQLSAVSCASPTSCTAVGSYYDSSLGDNVMLAEYWNGTGWSIQSRANPAGATYSELLGVSCPTTSACTAVGAFGSAPASGLALGERWNGSSWTVESVPNPAGDGSSQLSGVSCTSAHSCTATGSYVNSSGNQVTLAEGWNGTSWAVQPTPAPPGSQYSQLLAVSCQSINACTAVGDYSDAPGGITGPGITYPTLAERWNGRSWILKSSPNAAGAQTSLLSAVACASSSSACTAVGDHANRSGNEVTLAESWNGTSWSLQLSADPTGKATSQLSAISCSSASACTGVGDYVNDTGVQTTLAERRNGSSWAIEQTPNPAGATANQLLGISCPSVNTCVAVGDDVDAVGVQTALVERWSHGKWKIQSTPKPTSAASSELTGISCPSSSSCVAVGNKANRAGDSVPLVERWTGARWVIQSTPKEAGTLSAVSCSSTDTCTAVGTGDKGTLAERWTGSSWAVQPTPTDGVASNLSGVSCPSKNSCTAVGNTPDGYAGFPLAEHWNGSSWAIQLTGYPKTADWSQLQGVACSSTTRCTAVGAWGSNPGASATLAESWHGTTWNVQTTLVTNGSSLSGVSCPSSSVCTAAGTNGETLVEQDG